jgi:ankyrin repeat protein
MGRYIGTLHKLTDAGSSKPGNWNLILNYLEGYVIADSNSRNPRFDSPLPPYSAPSPDLARQLIDPQGPKREDTPLRIACRTAPSNLIAALCHLGPEATRMADGKGRLPLHWACRRSSEDKETDAVLAILIMTNPEALIHRDVDGRTPLHHLLWFHAKTRSAKLVELFCQPVSQSAFAGIRQPPQSQTDEFPLPQIPTPDASNKIPFSAVIVYDMKHGALPLHYAAAEGASKDVIRILLQFYPASKILCDRRGRTPLAWYLGAGELAKQMSHVSGEALDPNATAIWEKKLSSTVVQLLLNSKVARKADATGRVPLHWAMHLLARYYYNSSGGGEMQKQTPPCLSFGTVQLLLDNHIGALMSQDALGMTPLHVLFYAVAQHQEAEWDRMARNKTFHDDVDLVLGGSKMHVAFDPPSDLLEMLLRPPDSNISLMPIGERPICAAHAEDFHGRLPVHIALITAPSANAVRLLIQAHPTSLLETTEEHLQTPLHVALSSPYVAPLQTLDTIKILLHAYVTSRHGTYVDGRLVLKMEDASGRYPLHYACENQASLEATKLLLTSYPKSLMYRNANGDYPLHSLLDPNLFGESEKSRGMTIGATLVKPHGWTSDSENQFREKQHSILQEKMAMMIEPLTKDVEMLKVASAEHGMLPLHIAVAFDAVSYASIYQMLQTYPEAAKMFTTTKGHTYSPLDLHDFRRPTVKDEEQWHMLRELLFSFVPFLESHRRQEELLDRCCRIVRDELEGRGSSHSLAQVAMKNFEVPRLDLNASLSAIEVPEIDGGGRPKSQTPRTPKSPRTPQRAIKIAISKTVKSPKHQSPNSPMTTQVKKSIYDDDADLGYQVSQDGSFADDDYFSDEQSHESEYYSSDYDDDNDEESLFDDDTVKPRGPKDEVPKKDRKSNNKHEDATLSLTTQNDSESLQQSPSDSERPFLSDVAMRLWFFFAIFKDPLSTADHYAKQIEFLLDHLNFYTVQRLLLLPLPSYIKEFLDEDIELNGKLVNDVATAQCKAVIHMTFYFVGRYEFRTSDSDSILIRRSMDGNTVMVRATEYCVSTVESTEEEDPGDAEAAIWESGVAPSAPVTKSEFHVSKRTVCIKFMRSKQAYESDVGCRRAMGVPIEDEPCSSNHIIPLINYFNSNNEDRAADRRYRQDIQDDRFQRLQLGDGSSDRVDDYIFLPEYPYAVVMPYSDDGDLSDHLVRHGALDMDKIREVGLQVGQSLLFMHDKGLVHGNVSLRNVAGVPVSEESNSDSARYWALSDLTCASRQTGNTSFMAPIPLEGSVQFSTSAFPPEMFVKLTSGELKMYNDYWAAVESKHQGSIDKCVIQPRLDSNTGDVHVLRCYLAETNGMTLPPLPYKLLPVQEASDVWSFGRFLFTLCSSGHPLFSANMRSEQLLEYHQVATWDREKRERMIYTYVEDPLAQDILLHLLSSHEERASLRMETILKHPFFTTRTISTGDTDAAVRRLVEQREADSVACKRSFERAVLMRAEDEWLKSRSETILFWDLDLAMRMYLSPSAFIQRQYSAGHRTGTIPYSIIVLPYKLVRNKAGKLTPSTKRSVEMAEKTGDRLLAISKACYFAQRVEEVIAQVEDSSHKWSLSELSDSMNLSSQDFGQLESELATLASEKVEIFRDNPLSISQSLVRERIKELQTLYSESGKAYLYLVDEYEGVPIIGSTGDISYPIEVTKKVPEMVARALPFMHLCMLHARGIAGDVTGLVKLIFEAAYPHIPPSWDNTAKGLLNNLDESNVKDEVRMLREATADSSGTRGIDDMRFFQDYFERVDVKRTFAELKRVVNADSYIWTTSDGVDKIKDRASSHSLSEAYKAKQRVEEQLQGQQRKIAELEEALEQLEFRRKHNLQEPLTS